MSYRAIQIYPRVSLLKRVTTLDEAKLIARNAKIRKPLNDYGVADASLSLSEVKKELKRVGKARRNPTGKHKRADSLANSGIVYRTFKKAGVPMDNHATDLYVKATPAAMTIARKLGVPHTAFRSAIDGELWLEYPFAYLPAWAAKAGKKKPSRVKSNPHKAGSADKAAAKELLLFIDNDGELYRQQTSAIQKNLSKKFKAGKYSSTKAAKLWTYLADNGAKKYTWEYGDRRGSWHSTKGYGAFSAATRRLVGRLLEKSWHAEMKAGNFHS